MNVVERQGIVYLEAENEVVLAPGGDWILGPWSRSPATPDQGTRGSHRLATVRSV